jgi:hypothetical protein
MQALTRVNPTVYDSVAALCSDPYTTVVVFSGSDKMKLEETFGELDVWLAAENGIFMRGPDSEWSTLLEVRIAPSRFICMHFPLPVSRCTGNGRRKQLQLATGIT